MSIRLYSLYEKVGSNWNRISPYAYTKQSAIRVYQNQLLSRAMGMCPPGTGEYKLRPIPKVKEISS